LETWGEAARPATKTTRSWASNAVPALSTGSARRVRERTQSRTAVDLLASSEGYSVDVAGVGVAVVAARRLNWYTGPHIARVEYNSDLRSGTWHFPDTRKVLISGIIAPQSVFGYLPRTIQVEQSLPGARGHAHFHFGDGQWSDSGRLQEAW
jgi:hypothetical protein